MAELSKGTGAPFVSTGCACQQSDARYTQFETREVGWDETNGRYGLVTLKRCRSCRRLWLHYHVEYEAFSGSGRWARGLIRADVAEAITPEAAVPYLHGLEWYLYGGSYFDGVSGRRSGPMIWDL